MILQCKAQQVQPANPFLRVSARDDGECLCCFEVSNDRQIAARANGRGQPGMMGAQREQRGSTRSNCGDTALLQCSHREGVTTRAQNKHTPLGCCPCQHTGLDSFPSSEP